MRGVSGQVSLLLRLVNLRQLRRSKQRTALAMTAAAASAALVTALLLIHATLSRTIDDTSSGFGDRVPIAVTAQTSYGLPETLAQSVRSVSGVSDVIPVVRQLTRVHHGDMARRAMVVGVSVPPTSPVAAQPLGSQVGATSSPALSASLARRLGVRVGGSVEVDGIAGQRRLDHAVLLSPSVGLQVNGGVFAVLPLHQAQRLFGRRGRVDVIYVTTVPGISPRAIRREIARVAGPAARVGSPGGDFLSYKQTFEAISSTASAVGALGVALALMLIFGAAARSVAERHGEVALAGLSGALPIAQLAAFALEATLVGLLGGALGVACGTVLAQAGIEHARAQYAAVLPVSDVGPVVLSVAQALPALIVAVVVSVIGALAAGWRIMSVRPIDALADGDQRHGEPSTSKWRRRRLLGGIVLLVAATAGATASHGGDLTLSWLLLAWLVGFTLVLPSVLLPAIDAAGRLMLRPAGILGQRASIPLGGARGRAAMVTGTLTISAAVAIAGSSVSGAFRKEVERVAAGWNPASLYVRAFGAGLASDQPMSTSVGASLTSVPGVRAAYPMRIVVGSDGGHQVIVLALPVTKSAKNGDLITRDLPLGDHRLLARMARGDVVLSRLAALRRGVGIGDRVRLPVGGRVAELRVAGLFNDITSADVLYMDSASYTRLTGDRSADRFAILIDRRADPISVARRLRRLIAVRRLAAEVETADQMTDRVVGAVEGLLVLARIMLVAVLAVAGFTVIHTIFITSLARRREFGVQRLLGMSRAQLATIIVMDVARLTCVAAALALLLGLALSKAVTLMIGAQLGWEIPFYPQIGEIVAICCVLVVFGVLAALLPAWRATRAPIGALIAEEPQG